MWQSWGFDSKFQFSGLEVLWFSVWQWGSWSVWMQGLKHFTFFSDQLRDRNCETSALWVWLLGSRMLQSNRSGGVKAGPLVRGRQFIFRKEVIFEVCGDVWRFWVLGGGWKVCGEGSLLARLHFSKSGFPAVWSLQKKSFLRIIQWSTIYYHYPKTYNPDFFDALPSLGEIIVTHWEIHKWSQITLKSKVLNPLEVIEFTSMILLSLIGFHWPHFFSLVYWEWYEQSESWESMSV